MRRNFGFLATIVGFVAIILFFCIHLLALFIAYPNGLAQMLLTLILPIVAEVYWIIQIRDETGTFSNALTVLCLIWIILVIATFASSLVSRETA